MSEHDLMQLLQHPGVADWRMRLARLVEHPRSQWFIIWVILLNAAVLGLEVSLAAGPVMDLLVFVDRLCLAIFVVELLLKGLAYRWHMLRNGWNVFDILVVGVALVPAAGPFAVLRSMRVLRVFRLLTAVPAMRRVVAAFLHAIPGLSSVIMVMLVFSYVAAVMATGLFGGSHPEFFGDLGSSLYTLFQIMTLESWSMGIVRPVMEHHPWAWAFFIPFIVIATFTILNLFIGIIVSTMQELTHAEAEAAAEGDDGRERVLVAVERVEQELTRIREELGARRWPE